MVLCFSFKNINWLHRQTTQFDYSLSTLFVIFTSFGLNVSVKSLNPKQYIFPGLFPIFIGFVSSCVFFILCIFVKCFGHIVLSLMILSLQLFFQSLQQFYQSPHSLLFLHIFHTYKFILPTNLKGSKLESLGLHWKILKLCFFNISFFSFSSTES